MLLSDLLQETSISLRSNKSRSALTILGIVIGIASVITMISVGQGATQDISNRIQSLGTNLLTVSPGSNSRGPRSMVQGGMGSATTLIIEDAQAIEENISGIEVVASSTSSREQVVARGQNTNTVIYGIDENYFKVRNVEIEIGQSIVESNLKYISKVAILGPDTSIDLFGEGVNPIGEKIRIGGQQFTVIGVTKSKGGTGFGSSDDLIYIPITTAQHYITGSNLVSSINIRAREEELMDTVQADIESILLLRHNIKNIENADFSVMNQTDIMETMSSITTILTLLLASIAGISLLVGGIGIMNMMLTTISERTREIGLRKSLGAKKKDISNQFLAESITLTFIGGLMGIILGLLAAFLINMTGLITTTITLWSVMLSFGVSAIIGIVFGYYPAKRAANLNPIEALRYE